eukprot:Nk52_evm13s2630 gene=Nk52_evmTU13s2630
MTNEVASNSSYGAASYDVNSGNANSSPVSKSSEGSGEFKWTSKKHVKVCKGQHHEQIEKITKKIEEELAVVEECRSFMKKRAEIEAEYARNLDKLAHGFLEAKKTIVPGQYQSMRRKRSISKSVANSKNRRYDEVRIPDALFHLIKETDTLAKERAEFSRKLVDEVCDPLKTLHAGRLEDSKGSVEEVGFRQLALWNTYSDLIKVKKEYAHLETETIKSRSKKAGLVKKVTKRKTSKGNIFSGFGSIKSLDAKLTKKSEKLDKAFIDSETKRHAYILALAATNAHQEHFYKTEMDSLLDEIDGAFFDLMKKYLKSYCALEKRCVANELECMDYAEGVFDKINKANDRAYFLKVNMPTFRNPGKFVFEPCPGAEERTSSISLTDEVRPFLHVSMTEAEVNCVLAIQKKEKLQKDLAGVYSLESAGQSQVGEAMRNLKLEIRYLKRMIDLEEQKMVKLTSEIKALTSAGIPRTNNQEEITRRVLEVQNSDEFGNQSMISNGALNTSAVEAYFETFVPENEFDSASTSLCASHQASRRGTLTYPSSSVTPATQSVPPEIRPATVLYDYDGMTSDEISAYAGTGCQVNVASLTSDGWVHVNIGQSSGYIPMSYIAMASSPVSQPSAPVSPSEKEKEGAYDVPTMSSLDNLPRYENVEVASPKVNVDWDFLKGNSEGDIEVADLQSKKVKAVTNFMGTHPGELSFHQGEIIEILKKHSDSWWRGKVGDQIGNFPSDCVDTEWVTLSSSNSSNIGQVCDTAYDEPTAKGKEKIGAEDGASSSPKELSEWNFDEAISKGKEKILFEEVDPEASHTDDQGYEVPLEDEDEGDGKIADIKNVESEAIYSDFSQVEAVGVDSELPEVLDPPVEEFAEKIGEGQSASRNEVEEETTATEACCKVDLHSDKKQGTELKIERKASESSTGSKLNESFDTGSVSSVADVVSKFEGSFEALGRKKEPISKEGSESKSSATVFTVTNPISKQERNERCTSVGSVAEVVSKMESFGDFLSRGRARAASTENLSTSCEIIPSQLGVEDAEANRRKSTSAATISSVCVKKEEDISR